MFSQANELIIHNEMSDREKVFSQAQIDVPDFKTFSSQSKLADYFIDEIKMKGFSTSFRIQSQNWEGDYHLSMPGLFNVENATATIAGMDMLGIPAHYTKDALSAIRVPGRIEFYESADKMIIGIVDFAHNRLSFESLHQFIKENYPDYDFVSVFGVPGGKALGRAEKLGTIAAEYADKVYLTMDDPGKESVQELSERIAEYLKPFKTPHEIIDDRADAIKTAIAQSDGKTVILFAGKGREEYQSINGIKKSYLGDPYYVKKYIQQYNQKINTKK